MSERNPITVVSDKIKRRSFLKQYPLKVISLEKVIEDCRDLTVEMPNWNKDIGAGGLFDSFVISSVARVVAPENYFEIGTGDGRSSLLVSANTPESTRIYTLDPDYPDNPVKGSVFHGRPEAKKITQLGGYSQDFDFSPYNGKMDLVFVDGSHELNHVINDIGIAFKLIRKGGVILWHDVIYEHKDVIQAIHDSGCADKIYSIAGTAYGYYKDV